MEAASSHPTEIDVNKVKYLYQGPLGSGTFADVYAYASADGRMAAIKLAKPGQ